MTAHMVLDETAVASVRRILYAASRDEKHQLPLSTVHFDGDAAVATDAYRMAIAYFDGDPVEGTFSAREVSKALPRSGEWTINGSPEPLALEKPYLDWRKLLRPLRWSWAVSYERASLLEFVELVIADCSKKDSSPLVGLGGNVVPVFNRPTTRAALMQANVDGTPDGTVWVNGRFLRDMLTAAQTESVLLEFDGVHKPVMLRQPGCTHLLMPVHVP